MTSRIFSSGRKDHLFLFVFILLELSLLLSGCGGNNCVIGCPQTYVGPNSSPSVDGGSSSPGPTGTPSGGDTSPIAEGDFLYNPGAVTGPAIVEYWNGLGGASKICGTFLLPTGESFNYKAGHWWKYKSDQDAQAEWQLHVALYQQKPENAGCSIGQRP